MKKKIALLIIILIFSVGAFSIFITMLKKSNNTDMETGTPFSISPEANEPVDADGHNTTNENEETDTVLTHGFIELQQINMPHVCDDLFMFIKAVYDEYDFYGEFETGGSMVYDAYKEMFRRLFMGEAVLYDKTGETELFLSDFYYDRAGETESVLPDFLIDLKDAEPRLYFFDMDGDGTPELMIDQIGILKYDIVLDKIVLWHDLRYNYEVIGSKKIAWIHLGSGYGIAFYWLDATGEIEHEMFVYTFGKPEEDVYLVTLPLGLESDLIKNYDYRDRSNYYFRVTEGQFNVLTYELYNALEIAEDKIQEGMLTFTEFFSE